ncbi:TrkA C-terminal domain-containing protein [Paenibacillus sp. FJAT-27812]|uniref:TrkA C-terminal domain-containing protein n=1 Tax=Paenibacillus sp. FJAT-27812 TaxID=1684143 RepID=UPI0006A76090|nr:TrkA C-terminal domain-containing protein [Paenibacillus sp. FJAT-27812]
MGWLFIVIYGAVILMVVEIAASLLVVTGLDQKIARFQAVSMLTATGFTTKESELVIRHPIRRRIAVFLIAFGVFSLAVIISSLSQLLSQNFGIHQLVWAITALGAILIIVKNKRIAAFLTEKTEHHLEKEFALHELPIQEVLYIDEKTDFFTKIKISGRSDWLGKKVNEINHCADGFTVLLTERDGKKARLFDMKIDEGDQLFVYGNRSAIEKAFRTELKHAKTERVNEHDVTAI